VNKLNNYLQIIRIFKFAAEKKSLYKTGGGENSVPEPSELSQAVRALVSDPLDNPFDSDGKTFFIILKYMYIII